jgi:uncharacterized protein involved in exopolysaccharide biosynthesis
VTTVSNSHYDDEIDLLRYGRFLASYWMVLAGFAVAGALAGILVALLMPREFQATATLNTIQPSGAAALTPATAKALVANLTIATQTINEVGLNRDGMTAKAFVEDALDVQPVPSTTLLKVSVTLSDPAKARQAAALLATKVVDLSHRIDFGGVTDTRRSIPKQVADAEEKLKAARERLIQFQTTAEIERLQAETNSTFNRRVEIENQRIQLDGERARLEVLEQEFARQPAELPVPRASGAEGALPGGGRQRPANGDPYANPVHTLLQYDIAQSKARISSLERQQRQTTAAMSDATVTGARSELYRRRLELSQLQAEYDMRNRIYTDLAIRYDDSPARAAAPPQLQLLDPPVQPDAPLPRHRPQFAALGALIGGFFGVVAALLINRRRLGRPAA